MRNYLLNMSNSKTDRLKDGRIHMSPTVSSQPQAQLKHTKKKEKKGKTSHIPAQHSLLMTTIQKAKKKAKEIKNRKNKMFFLKITTRKTKV